MSHHFAERLIGSVRRELLDQTFSCTQADLEQKLHAYQQCLNEHRCHSGLDGTTPVKSSDTQVIDLSHYRQELHYRDLFQLPVAA
jgi:hypothetical protein